MSTQTIDLPLGADADCPPCSTRIREAIADMPGVRDVASVRDHTALRVTLEPSQVDEHAVTAAIDQTRAAIGLRFEHRDVGVTGMDCADCATRIEHTVARMPGVAGVSVSVAAARMRLELERDVADLADVRERLQRLGYGLDGPDHDHDTHGPEHDGHEGADGDASPIAASTAPAPGPLKEWADGSSRVTVLAAGVLALAGIADLIPGLPQGLVIALYALSTAIGGLSIARSGWRGTIATRRPDMNLLMAIAVAGAVAIGAWMEAALVVVLFSIGELLERRAVSRARRELEGLLSLTPPFARVRRSHRHGDGAEHAEEHQVLAEQLVPGDVVVVLAGERIPADGTITEGSSTVDQAPVTGESTPVDRSVGDPVFAGTLNGGGRLVLTTTRAGRESTVAQIAKLVGEAQARRSPSERWVSAFARIYTPVIIAAALAITTLLPLAGLLTFGDAFYAALALLILACPCALVLSTPVSIVSALGRASAAGVLVKGGAHLERAATITTVAFDKTGTLTQGTPRVAAIHAVGDDGVLVDEEAGAEGQLEILRLAAALERGSAHPLAVAIVAAADEEGPAAGETITAMQELAGLGASGLVDGAAVRVGSPRLLAGPEAFPSAHALTDRLQRDGLTAVLVEREGWVIGAIGLADEPRPEAAQAIEQLTALGIKRTVMLTGDNQATADRIAALLGVSDVRAGLMPAEKATAIAELPGIVAMVGDGINDTPALATAALGVAMGSAGSDAAIQVADVALMGDDPRKVAGLIALARWTQSIVRQNIAFSLGTKVIAAGFLLFGALPLWAAVGVDVGASLVVVANGLRLVRQYPIGSRGAAMLTAGD